MCKTLDIVLFLGRKWQKHYTANGIDEYSEGGKEWQINNKRRHESKQLLRFNYDRVS